MTEWLVDAYELTDVQAQLVVSIVVVALLVLVRLVVVQVITRRVDNASVWYRSRKATTYLLAFLGVLSLVWVWVEELGNVGTFLGLAAAGIAIALSDMLKNVAGWFYILLRRPYQVDDRIEMDGVAGDVIDIRLFRTTLLEIRNWVDADQSTGRIVHVPNGKVFSTHVFNFTEGFAYLWHEVPVRITFESDWHRAEELMLGVLNTVAGHTAEDAGRRIQDTAKSYKIRYTHLTPAVYVAVREHGIVLTGRVLVDARRRRAVDQQVWRSLLDAFAAEPSITFAYPATRAYFGESLRLDGADGRGVPATAEQPADDAADAASRTPSERR